MYRQCQGRRHAHEARLDKPAPEQVGLLGQCRSRLDVVGREHQCVDDRARIRAARRDPGGRKAAVADDMDVPCAIDELRRDDLLCVGECREPVAAHTCPDVGLQSIAPGPGLLEAAGLGQGRHPLVDRGDDRTRVAGERVQCLLRRPGVRIGIA